MYILIQFYGVHSQAPTSKKVYYQHAARKSRNLPQSTQRLYAHAGHALAHINLPTQRSILLYNSGTASRDFLLNHSVKK